MKAGLRDYQVAIAAYDAIAPGGVKAEPRGPYSRSRALHVATVLTCGLYVSSHPAGLHRTQKGAPRWKLSSRMSERVRQHRHARAARLLSGT